MVVIPGSTALGTIAAGGGITVVISAIDRFSAVFKKAQLETKKTGLAFTRFAKAGVATVAVIGAVSIALSTKLETAMVGVRKTTGLAADEIDDLREKFVAMSKQSGISAEQLASIGIIAGQLGIQGKDDIASFTQIVAEMGTATVLTTDAAALGLARLSAIMQEPISQARNMASAFVALGNTIAANEEEILNMSLRLAGAGKAVGLTTAQVLGFSAALAELGIRAEAGGSAFSRLFLRIDEEVTKGGRKLDLFAKTAGLTTEEFVRLFRDDAGEATTQFIEGLGSIADSGGNATAILAKLGITEVRLRDAILRTSNASEKVRADMELANGSFKQGTALSEEYNQALDSASVQWGILTERLKSYLITDNKLVKGTLKRINVTADLRAEQRKLDKAFKDGAITAEDYNRIQEVISTQQATGQLYTTEGMIDVVGFLREQYDLLTKSEEDAASASQNISGKVLDENGNVITLQTSYEKLQEKIREFEDARNEEIALGLELGLTNEEILKNLEQLKKNYPEAARGIDFMTNSLLDFTDAGSQSLDTLREILDEFGPGTQLTGSGIVLPAHKRFSKEEVKDVKDVLTSVGGGTTQADDFIMRPGQRLVEVNPQDTIVGFKGDSSPVGQSTSIGKVDIIVQGAGQNADQIARTIQERLATLGRPILGL